MMRELKFALSREDQDALAKLVRKAAAKIMDDRAKRATENGPEDLRHLGAGPRLPRREAGEDAAAGGDRYLSGRKTSTCGRCRRQPYRPI